MAELKDFAVGEAVRYRPGAGTNGYKTVRGADGRVPAVVVGHGKTRVRVRVTMDSGHTRTRAVWVTSLEKVVPPLVVE
jgi:ribosomal protein L25 (general stress protein Ctc)